MPTVLKGLAAFSAAVLALQLLVPGAMAAPEDHSPTPSMSASPSASPAPTQSAAPSPSPSASDTAPAEPPAASVSPTPDAAQQPSPSATAEPAPAPTQEGSRRTRRSLAENIAPKTWFYADVVVQGPADLDWINSVLGRYRCVLPDGQSEEGETDLYFDRLDSVAWVPVGSRCTITSIDTGQIEKEGYDVDITGLEQEVEVAEADDQGVAPALPLTLSLKPAQVPFNISLAASPGDATAQSATVHYVCHPKGETAQTGEVTLLPGESKEAGSFAWGTVCEATSVTAPSVKGQQPHIELGARQVLDKRSGVTASVRLTYREALGTVVVNKVVKGDFAGIPDKFTIVVGCQHPGDENVTRARVTVTPGTPAVAGTFAPGMKCKAIDEAEADVEGLKLVTDFGPEATTTAGATTELTVTNTYHDWGRLILSVDGSENGTRATLDPVEVSYTCAAPGVNHAGDPIPASGRVEVSHESTRLYFPIGAKCAVTQVHAPQRDGFELATSTGTPVNITKTISDWDGERIQIGVSYATNFAKLSLTYAAAGEVPDKLVDLHATYRCSSAGKDISAYGKVTIPVTGTVEFGEFPVGTECEFYYPEYPGLDPYYYANIDASKDVTVTEGGITHTLTSTFTKSQPFSLEIKPQLLINNTPLPDKVTYDYVCSKEGLEKRGSVQLASGETATVDDLPFGTSCVITPQLEDRPGHQLLITDEYDRQLTEINAYPSEWSKEVAFTIRYYPLVDLEIEYLKPQADVGNAPVTYYYRCYVDLASSIDLVEGSVHLAPGETAAVSKIPVGATCMVTRNTDSWRDGYRLVNSESEETEIVSANQRIQITNTYEPIARNDDSATLFIENRVAGRMAAPDELYTIYFNCWTEIYHNAGPQPGDHDANFASTKYSHRIQLRAGEVKGVPWPDDHCRLTHIEDAERTNYSLVSIFSPQADRGVHGKNVLTVTNQYTAHTGEFVVTKQINDGGSTGPATYELTYQCSAPGQNNVPAEGTINVTASQPHSVGHFPVGTTCAVTGEHNAQRTGYTLETNLGAPVTIEHNQTHDVTVVNTYTEVPKPTDPPNPGNPSAPADPPKPTTPATSGTPTPSAPQSSAPPSKPTAVASTPGKPRELNSRPGLPKTGD